MKNVRDIERCCCEVNWMNENMNGQMYEKLKEWITEWMNEWKRCAGGKNTEKRKPTSPTETYLFSHRQFHVACMGPKSGLHHERPVTKRLSHDKRKYGVEFFCQWFPLPRITLHTAQVYSKPTARQ